MKVFDYDSNINNNNITEDKKIKIIKLNEELDNLIRKWKLEISVRNTL